MATQHRYSAFRDLAALFIDAANSVHFGEKSDTAEYRLHHAIKQAEIRNSWFTEENIKFRLKSLGEALLNSVESTEFTTFNTDDSYEIGMIPAGRIPLQGFEDLFAVLMTSHRAAVKPAEEDKVLMEFVIDFLQKADVFSEDEVRVAGQLKGVEAVIISCDEKMQSSYKRYFGHLPHLIRTRKYSISVLDNSTTDEELNSLSSDIFHYFGLGDGTVHKLLLPKDFDKNRLFDAFYTWNSVMENNKYMNNYEYHRTLFLLEDLSFQDNNFVILREKEEVKSPVGVLHYEMYSSMEEVKEGVKKESEWTENVCGKGFSCEIGESLKVDLSSSGPLSPTLNFLKDLKGKNSR